MGCACTKAQFCLSDTMYVFEKLASCCAMSAVVICIIATVIFVLTLGIGVGYNYCYVDLQVLKTDSVTDEKNESSKNGEAPSGTGQAPLDSSGADKAPSDPSGTGQAPLDPGGLTPINARRAFGATDDSAPIFIAPLHDSEYIMNLISKLRVQNKNVTLQLQAK